MPLQHKKNGFVLLEGLIAIAIFSFALLGLVGLQGLSIKNSMDAKYRADAAYAANQLIGQMWVDRSNLASYAYRATETACNTSATAPTYAPVTAWLADVAQELPGVQPGSTSGQKPQVVVDTSNTIYTMVTVTICWRSPKDDQAHSHVATAQINN